jgi:hypothetical protein
LVILPRVSVDHAIALGQRLILAAKAEGELPEGIAEAIRSLKRRHRELSDNARARSGKTRSEEAKMEGHRAANAVWAATHAWLSGWTKLPSGGEEAALAQKLFDVLFEDGLNFLHLKYEAEWVASDRKLTDLVEKDLEDAFAELGGQRFLAQVRRVHKEYGKALGLTQARVREQQAPLVRDALDAFTQSLRQYVVQVTAHSELEGAHELAERLLAPVVEWRSAPAKRKDAEVESTGTAPAPAPSIGSGSPT